MGDIQRLNKDETISKSIASQMEELENVFNSPKWTEYLTELKHGEKLPQFCDKACIFKKDGTHLASTKGL